jgi:hypothetical protein
MDSEYSTFRPLQRNRDGRVDRNFAFRSVSKGIKMAMQDKSLARIWNWGGNENVASIAKTFKIDQGVVIIDSSLTDDLYFSLFDDRLDSIIPEANKSFLFASLKNRSREFVNVFVLHLDELGMFETGRPIAHVFSDLIACITFLRKRATREIIDKKHDSDIFQMSRIEFWEEKLGMHPFYFAE